MRKNKCWKCNSVNFEFEDNDGFINICPICGHFEYGVYCYSGIATYFKEPFGFYEVQYRIFKNIQRELNGSN